MKKVQRTYALAAVALVLGGLCMTGGAARAQNCPTNLNYTANLVAGGTTGGVFISPDLNTNVQSRKVGTTCKLTLPDISNIDSLIGVLPAKTGPLCPDNQRANITWHLPVGLVFSSSNSGSFTQNVSTTNRGFDTANNGCLYNARGAVANVDVVAAGQAGGGGGGSSAKPPVPKCFDYEVLDKKNNVCVKKLQCSKGFQPDKSNKKCVKKCSKGWHADASGKKCVKDAPKCGNGWVLNKDKTKCVKKK